MKADHIENSFEEAVAEGEGAERGGRLPLRGQRGSAGERTSKLELKPKTVAQHEPSAVRKQILKWLYVCVCRTNEQAALGAVHCCWWWGRCGRLDRIQDS